MTIADFFGLDEGRVWDTQRAFERLQALGQADTKRTAERRLHELELLPPELGVEGIEGEGGIAPVRLVLEREAEQARSRRRLVLFAQLHRLASGREILCANDARSARYWVPLEATGPDALAGAWRELQSHLGKEITVLPHARLVGLVRALPEVPGVRFALLGYPPPLELPAPTGAHAPLPPHLQRLEAESIYIIREAVADAERPVMLYSVGKDSSAMLHLARKAFYPARPPFALLHVDTRWKFQEMYRFRDRMAQESGMDLIVHVNPEAVARDINPFDHGSALHTDITKTQGLKQALDQYGFDVAFGGARRDEEKSRAKERIFSFRTQAHRWDPKNQRPELWNLYNTQKSKGESIRVFPLSNWTELDVWQYIHHEHIPVVPLYFARERPVVVRDGLILMVDDDRFDLLPGEQIESRRVRFRTLGCYPLTGAIESAAQDVPQILLELVGTGHSERQGRAIDSDSTASMEKKKQEGYF